jgi:hypothetical protein
MVLGAESPRVIKLSIFKWEFSCLYHNMVYILKENQQHVEVAKHMVWLKATLERRISPHDITNIPSKRNTTSDLTISQ